MFKIWRTSEFMYELPEKQIAQVPLDNREDSKLMVVDRKKQKIEIKKFPDILNYLNEGDVIVLNNTKVFWAKIYGYKQSTGGKIEVLLVRELVPEEHLWDTIVSPPRKIRVGNKLIFGKPNSEEFLTATVMGNSEKKGKIIKFLFEGTSSELREIIKQIGEPPLPPYIKREANKIDRERYQTVYAQVEGSIAAPTAGLHFTELILKKIQLKGVKIAYVTLHIGYGTFELIRTEDVSRHMMGAEYLEVPEETVEIINTAKKNGKRVLAVGTSVVRALESAPNLNGELKPYKGWSTLFIYPPYENFVADALLTNFHLPRSPSLVLTWTFGGIDLLKKAYSMAIKEKFRFLTYGDAMLII